MAAPKKNKFWMARSSHGRKPIFKDPDKLFDACCEYFDWVDKNPLQESKIFVVNKSTRARKLPKMRAMTKIGLCRFLDICENTWDNYKAKQDFLRVCEAAEGIIFEQKFTGAAAGLLNPAIIARELGLADKKAAIIDIHNFKDMTDEELIAEAKMLEQEISAGNT